ncbi:MAG: hypothetical protein DSM106950_01340 [Stigonema ocellatum SAG 48.90 = DSM 106950]|nr:hypothetical protein [Stigonema ocellatum SAG 48.90 = DSM 106950]
MTSSIDIWTEKHEEFCLENGITPSAKLLWQWLMRLGKLSDEAEPDLTEFNEWVAKHRGKGYSRPTLKAALEQLKSLRVIQIVKKFTWRIFRLVVRPLEWLFPKKPNKFGPTKVKLVTNRVVNFYLEKNFQNRSKTFKSQPSNPQSSDAGSKQQQQSPLIQENLSILSEAGITFKPKELEVLDRPTNEIKLALIMFELRGGFEKTENPEGWIRTCLRERYWEEDRNYEALLNRLGNLTIWSELFGDATSSPISPFGLDINSKYIRTAPY